MERPAESSGCPSPLTPATLSQDWTAPPSAVMTPSWRRHPASPGAITASHIQQRWTSEPNPKEEGKSKHKLRENTSNDHLNEWRDFKQPFSRLSAQIMNVLLLKIRSHLLSPEPLSCRLQEEFNQVSREDQKELMMPKRCLHSFVDLIEAEHFSFNIYAKVDSLLIQTAVPYMWLIT